MQSQRKSLQKYRTGEVEYRQKDMQTKSEKQTTFFELAIQQRGAVNQVLETIAREVDFSSAEQQVATTYAAGGRPAYRVAVLLRVMIFAASLRFKRPAGRTANQGSFELPEVRPTGSG
jgi:hypothetical protein